jgi:hypothetical protein
MADALKRRDVGNTDPGTRIAPMVDRLAGEQSSAGLNLQKMAAAQGYGTGGGIQAGLQSMASQFAGQRADQERGIRQDVSQENEAANRAEENRLLQALGIAGSQMNARDQLGISEQELALRTRGQDFAEQQAKLAAQRQQQALDQEKQNSMLQAIRSINSGGGGAPAQTRGGQWMQVLGGGAVMGPRNSPASVRNNNWW